MTALAEAGLWERFWANEFYQTALLGGVGIALLTSVLSVFVVLKRMSFIGQGIAHAAFGGVGAALLGALFVPALRVGASAATRYAWPVVARDGIIAVFCVATALAIGSLSRRGKLSADASIGICLVAAMALGVVLMDVRAELLERLIADGELTRGEVGYAPSFHHVLFGNILFMNPAEVAIVWGLAVACVAWIAAMFKELVFFAFDEETAAVFGVPTGPLYYALLVVLALAIVVAMRSMGVILASGMLILPGASARQWSDRIGRVTVLSAVIGVAGVVTGLLLAMLLDFLSPAPLIVLALTLLFGVSFAARTVRRRRRTRSCEGTP